MKNHDLELILPLKLIREHTKTDDTPSVTDDQLMLYRKDSFEVAEQYTGKRWVGFEEHIQEYVRLGNSRRGFHTVRLEKPSTDGKVVLYGGSLANPMHLHTEPGSTILRVPDLPCGIPFNDCCRGNCDDAGYGMRAIYNVGVRSPEDVPAGIIMGCLRLIAWNVSNAGDVIMTTRNVQAFSNSGALQGTNNGAWASGAIEQWRVFR